MPPPLLELACLKIKSRLNVLTFSRNPTTGADGRRNALKLEKQQSQRNIVWFLSIEQTWRITITLGQIKSGGNYQFFDSVGSRTGRLKRSLNRISTPPKISEIVYTGKTNRTSISRGTKRKNRLLFYLNSYLFFENHTNEIPTNIEIHDQTQFVLKFDLHIRHTKTPVDVARYQKSIITGRL